MKRKFILSVAAVAFFIALPADAAKPHQGGAKKKGSTAPSSERPSERLAFYVQHMNELLTLEYNFPSKLRSRLTQAPGDIARLRAALVVKRAAAKPEEQPVLDAAVRVCDTLTLALDERRQTIAGAIATRGVRASSSHSGKRGKAEVKAADKFFDAQIKATWVRHKTELLTLIEATYAALRKAESRQQP